MHAVTVLLRSFKENVVHKKIAASIVAAIFHMEYGGDEESRTPVHNTFKTDFYKFSLFFMFIFTAPTNRFYKNISFLNTHCFER